MFRQLTRFTKICLTVTLFLFTNIANAATPEVGQTYYTQHNFKFERGRHLTTNYWRGEFVQLNSKAKVISITDKNMVLEINGRSITIRNIAKFSKRTIAEVAENLLSPDPVLIGNNFANDIKFGRLRYGMTKQEVIMTRGYPPGHKTFSTESDFWIYWSSRFVTHSLAFENGKLNEGRGLR